MGKHKENNAVVIAYTIEKNDKSTDETYKCKYTHRHTHTDLKIVSRES